jgi:hypothetical protein
MKKRLFVLSIVTAMNSFGALPPLHQSIREIKQVMATNPSQLKRELVSLVRTDQGIVEMTLDCRRTSSVSYIAPPFPGFAGPAQFQITTAKPVCKTIQGKSRGYATSVQEINTVLDDKELSNLISGSIRSITRTAGGYVVSTDSCFVHAQLQGDTSDSLKAIAIFGKPTCK